MKGRNNPAAAKTGLLKETETRIYLIVTSTREVPDGGGGSARGGRKGKGQLRVRVTEEGKHRSVGKLHGRRGIDGVM